MKVLHIVECFGGGVYDFIKNLTDDMDEYEVTILYGDRGELRENFKDDFNKNIKFIKWENAQREISLSKDIKALFEVIKVLRKEKYDVIHLHSSKAGFLGRAAAKLVGQSKNVIYTTHGISFLRQDISNRKLKLFILLEKIGEICGGQTIACSKSEAEFIKAKGIACEYINNGIKIDENFIKQPKKDDVIRIINIGRITEQKNPKLFNEIAKKFVYNPKIKFIWVGEGEDRKLLSSENIEITGWLSQEQVKERLKEADIYLSTSKWEGLSLAVLQAMNYELPLILSNCVGNVDLVEEEINAFLYSNIKEGVKILRREYKNIVTKKINSKQIVRKKFNLLNTIKRYEDLYIKNFHEKKIKVVHVVSRLEFGGVENVILNYTQKMKDIKEYEFHIITQDINSQECINIFKDNNFIVHTVIHKRKNFIKNIIQIIFILKKEKYNIIHSHMNLLNFYIMIIGKLLKIKIRISHAHSAIRKENLIQNILNFWMRILNNYFSNIKIACGKEASNFIYGEKEKRNVIILRNAIDIEKFGFDEKVRDCLRKIYKIDKNEKIIGHIGRFAEVKNHIFLLKLLEKLEKNIRLVLVGDGELFNKIQKEVIKRKLEGRVIFIKNTTQVERIYQMFDLFILPSLYEGIPLVAIEAQCSGLPCLLSNTIDRECKIIKKVLFLSLEDDLEIWISYIKKMLKNKRKKEMKTEEILNFDINLEANKLSFIYRSALKNVK